MSEVKVGTCGFGRTERKRFGEILNAVEIQHTFYYPPDLKTLAKWRSELHREFEFTLKTWQMITHEASSPTYRRLKRPLTDEEMVEAGFFRSTRTVSDAWRLTLDCAAALEARTVLFQCPTRFQPTPENILNFKRFFSEADRRELNFAWEPRGKLWDDDLVRELCDEFDLWHCVDPFERETVTPGRCYFRLHGIPRWRYTYEDDELFELPGLLSRSELSYVFFNNMTMKDDAVRFSKVLEDQTTNL